MDKDRIKTFAEKVNQDAAGAMTVGMAYIGTRMGLFRAMAGKGPMDAASVAKLSGLQPRYVEEWLKGPCCWGRRRKQRRKERCAASSSMA